jgi:hypothetical protein
MAQIIWARGLIMGAALTDQQFDAMGLNVAWLANVSNARYVVSLPATPLANLKLGDWAVFNNAAKCPDAMWQAENVIVVGTNAYFGWDKGIQTYYWWRTELMNKFNASCTPLPGLAYGLTPFQYVWGLWQIPGYQHEVFWLNIPALGQMIFNAKTALP